MSRERALNLLVTASATVLVAVIAATAIAGALSRSGSSATDNHARLDRGRDAKLERTAELVERGHSRIVLRFSRSR